MRMCIVHVCAQLYVPLVRSSFGHDSHRSVRIGWRDMAGAEEVPSMVSDVIVPAPTPPESPRPKLVEIAQPSPRTAMRATDLHPYSAKLPTPKKSGNRFDDSNADAVHLQLQQTVDIIFQDRSHVVATFAFLTNR